MKPINCLFFLLLFNTFSEAQNLNNNLISKVQEQVHPIEKLQKANQLKIAKNIFSKNEKLQAFLLNDSINEIKEYVWNVDNSDWQISNTIYKFHNEMGYLKSYSSIDNNGTKKFQVDIETDNNGNFVLETHRELNQLGVLENSVQYMRSFNSNNLLTSQIDRSWDKVNSRWINQERRVYAYNNTGDVMLDEYSIYSFGGWEIVEGIRYDYLYNNGNFKQLIIKMFDPQLSFYANYKKYEYQFDLNSRLISNETSDFDASEGIWIVNFRNLFYYDNNNPSNTTPFRIDNIAFRNDTAFVKSRLDSVEWKDWKNTNNYEANTPSKFINSDYNPSTLTFEKTSKYFYRITDQNDSEISEQYEWLNNNWKLNRRFELVYDDQKSITANKVTSLQGSTYREDIILYLNAYDSLNRMKEIIEQNNFNPSSTIINQFKYEYNYKVSNAVNVSNLLANTFEIYPNPSTEKVYLKINPTLEQNQTVKIHNVQGQLVQELLPELHSDVIELSIKQHGIYLVSYNGYQVRIFIQP